MSLLHAALDVDMDSGWISDDNLRTLAFDERLNQEIDWVEHDDILKMEPFAGDDDDSQSGTDDQEMFAFGPHSFLSPLRGGLTAFDDAEMSPSFVESLVLDPPVGHGKNAEKLLMSFDTMNFTIPSPTNGSTRKKRAGFFGKSESMASDRATVRATSAASTGSMSPSLKLKVGPGSAAAEELRKEQARMASEATASSLSITSPDPFLGVFSISTPTSSSQCNKKIGSYSPEARKLRIQKFHEKRKNRTWKKSIKYDCRKKLADDRPRIKGRFVRVLENMCDIKEEEMMSPTSVVSPTVMNSFTPPMTPVSLAEDDLLTTPPSPQFPMAAPSPTSSASADAAPVVAPLVTGAS